MNYTFKTKEYFKCSDYKHIELNDLYNDSTKAFETLDYDLSCIIYEEAPLTMNTLKERMREVFDLKKISGKALDIIDARINALGFIKTDNLFDKTLWTPEGVFKQNFIRTGYLRQIYDIPLEEISLLSKDLKNRGVEKETHHREILKYFGYEVLTEKAREYLDFVYKNS